MSKQQRLKNIFLPSLLDRLIDDAPDKKTEPAKSQHRQIRDLISSIKRDLENLLNTREPLLEKIHSFVELKKSLANYGVSDFSTVHLDDNAASKSFCRLLQEKILLFEPRLKNVQVQLLPHNNPFDRMVRLRIQGVIQIEAITEPVTLDSVMSPESTIFVLNEVAS